MQLLKKILVTLFAIAFVIVIPQSGIIPFPFAYSIPVLIFIWLFLKLNKEGFAALGFSFKRFEIKAVVVGMISAIVLFAFINYAFFPLLKKMVELPPGELGGFNKVRHNTPFYIFILAMGWIVGGFYEEFVFHGFIFTRLEKLIGGKHAITVSFWLSNAIFALYHLQLGIGGVINAFIAGAGYHALILRHQRNMWYGIFCHAAFDTIAITYIYLGIW
jgi:membrane protease YdiL (CAAX protease family)